ncbi:MAG: MoxR family ATPase [Candidatus Sericytochromatia bacterium]
MDTVAAKKYIDSITQNIETVFTGKSEIVKLVVTALVAHGHVLLEDVPGVGKTLLAKSIAKSILGTFKRIQFTSDLLPTDITGVSIYNQKKLEFEYMEGPVFTNILLADEVNRGTPRTQSSLLEAMEEKQVSVDGVTRKLPEPFFVIATQNPIESQGTFPLPDSQLDRFIISLSIGYPSLEAEIEMLKMHNKKQDLSDNLSHVIDIQELIKIQNLVEKVQISNEIYQYIIKVVSATRNNNEILLGGSPRCSVALLTLAKAYALVNGRDFVIPDDIKYLSPYVLVHRIMPYRNQSREQLFDLVKDIINKVSVS